MKNIHTVAFILVIVGGLNWLLVGIVPAFALGSFIPATIAKIVYILVGISAIYLIATHKKTCSACKSCTCGTCDSCKADAPKM